VWGVWGVCGVWGVQLLPAPMPTGKPTGVWGTWRGCRPLAPAPIGKARRLATSKETASAKLGNVGSRRTDCGGRAIECGSVDRNAPRSAVVGTTGAPAPPA